MVKRQGKPGRRERVAGKRQKRCWYGFVGVHLYAPFTYWIRYQSAALASGLEPLKLGRKHRNRIPLFEHPHCVADSRNDSKSKRCD